MIIIASLLFLISFSGTMYVMPRSVRKLTENGYVVRDMYKLKRPNVPTNAGMILVFTSFISISLLPLMSRFVSFIFDENLPIADLSEENLAFLLVISIFALYGLVDDLVDIGRILKLVLPITFSYPLISVVTPEDIWIPLIGNYDLSSELFMDVTRSDIFRVIIIPIYVMVVANLVNMHSGYNGLQSGLSLILVFTLLLKSYQDGILDRIIPAVSILGAIVAFFIYNKYPSKVFEGNIGSLFFGSTIGAIIVIQEYWWFGFFILIPHTFNFLLWVIWLFLMRSNPDKYLDKTGNHTKFGRVGDDGILIVPNFLTLKWIPNYYFGLNERNTVFALHGLTLVVCLIGYLIF